MTEWFESNFETDTWLRIHEAYWRTCSAAEVAERLEGVMSLRPKSRILDVPCGIGHLSAALADRGHTVHGVDRSAKVLEAARSHIGDRAVTLDRRDMRELDAEAEFDAAICWWGSFGYFGDEGDEAFVQAVRRALVPGGTFLIEGFVMESLLPMYLPSGLMHFDDIMVVDQRRLNIDTSVIESTWRVIESDELVEVMEVRVRLYPWLQLRSMLERAGFEEVTLLDSATLEPFQVTPRGARTLALAR